MKKAEMVCATCIIFDADTEACCLNPLPIKKAYHNRQWCGQGRWQEMSKRLKDVGEYFWGEWDKDKKGDPVK